jgi:uncharacterized membrane protein (UPF0127 family)
MRRIPSGPNIHRTDQILTIGEKVTVRAQVVETPEDIERGLSGRELMAADEAMLFVFEEKDTYPFWMRDMRFPIDILWISDDQIVDLDEGLNPSSFPQTFESALPINRVLEVPAGFVQVHQIKEGDRITQINSNE